jgi:hypothetical protein
MAMMMSNLRRAPSPPPLPFIDDDELRRDPSRATFFVEKFKFSHGASA